LSSPRPGNGSTVSSQATTGDCAGRLRPTSSTRGREPRPPPKPNSRRSQRGTPKSGSLLRRSTRVCLLLGRLVTLAQRDRVVLEFFVGLERQLRAQLAAQVVDVGLRSITS